MDARERWQTLQARLTAARAAVDAGNRERALEEITAALELDKDFLAAQALLDRITSMNPEDPSAVSQAQPSTPVPTAPAAPPAATKHIEGAAPVLAKFEQRAKRRRVDRRIDAARAAIAQQRLKAAAAALDEIIDLDPNLPELAELTAEFDALRRASATPHRGPWVAAAAVFAGALLGGTWLQDSTPILSRQIVAAAPLPDPLTPALAEPELPPTGTTGTREHEADADVVEPILRVADTGATLPMEPAVRPAVRLDSPPVSIPATEVVEAVSSAPPPALVVAPVPAAVPASAPVPAPPPAPVPVSVPVSPTVAPPDDQVLVKQALQRYRKAYEGLDARSAQAVWPAVNEAALARAFDGLESQSLTFEACDVRLRGEAASATCHGSARYVPKVGSREPRVEPRVWNFTLHKAGADWTIDAARTER
jgi:tetratricopeptide (TPR) repeat protein